MIPGPLLTLPAAALRTTARILRVLADTGEVLAAVVGKAEQRSAPPAAAPAEPVVDTPRARPVPAEPDIAALASRTAPEVIASLDNLSTAALTDLYEHESRNRRRRTVLDAIERATMPPDGARAPAPVPPNDTRLDDELVYSTQTRRRG